MKYLLILSLAVLTILSCKEEKNEPNPVEPTEPTTSKTIWSGATMTFTKTSNTDAGNAANQDRLTDNVWITRGTDGGQIYNAKSESTASKDSSPAGTKWAVGSISDIDNLTFKNFRAAVGTPKNVVGKKLVLFLEKDSIYVPVEFTSWDTQKTGGFAYKRATKN